MRYLKSNGAKKEVQVLKKIQRGIWFLSLPISPTFNLKMQDVFKYSLKRSEKVKTLPTKTSVKLRSTGEAIIDFDLLLQRLVVLKNGCNITF